MRTVVSPPEGTRRRCPTLAWCARVFLVCPARGPGLPGGSPWEAGVTIQQSPSGTAPLRPALARQVWGCQNSASRGPGLIGPLFFPKGRGLNSDPGPTFRKQGIDQAGNLKPPFRASSIRRSRSDVFSASVAVFRFTPAASYMR
jgi:hypothetical protein